jgi:hypothetical protein
MKLITEIIWGIVISVILMVIGISADISILNIIGGFGFGYYLGKLSFIGMEKKHG